MRAFANKVERVRMLREYDCLCCYSNIHMLFNCLEKTKKGSLFQ